MGRLNAFSLDEWYHCFNRGVDKRKVFLRKSDYERFLTLLYLSNGTEPVRLDNLMQSLQNQQGRTLLEIALEENRGEPLVDIGAYCLMPNHFHLLLREKTNGGISEFMRKVGTGYTMYFNKKNERTGPLLGGKFRTRHILDDAYLKRVVNYIHANPAELIEPDWKEGRIKNVNRTRVFLESYPYGSMGSFLGSSDLQNKIVNLNLMRDYYESLPESNELFEDARTFAKDGEDL